MNKTTLNKRLFKQNDLLTMSVALAILSLMVSWAVELLAKGLFYLG